MPGNPGLRGRISDFLFGNMSKLLTFVICASSVAGDFPQDIVNMTNLQVFIGSPMNGEGFTGNLPQDLGNMAELRYLSLGGNNLTGQIPRSISRLNKLYYLDLRNTPGMMHGRLSDLFAISSLQYLFVSGMEFIGKMPPKFPAKLKYLVLPGNKISGKLPETFPNDSKLQVLNVANNQLKGDIPGHLLLRPLDMIDLSQNQFTSINGGEPWQKDANATINFYLSFAENRNLSVDFKSFMALFKARSQSRDAPSVINVSFCGIESPVLPDLFYLPGMSTCDLRGNNFHGPIPDVLADLSTLSYFDVSVNNLSGSLPGGIQNLIALQFLDISGNPLMRKGTSISSNVFKPDFSRMVRPLPEDNFTCPEGRLTFNNGRIRLDPTFYEYRYCICDANFYGDSGLCQQCMDGGTCHHIVVTETDDLHPNVMKIAPGYWPSPGPKNATHLVKCPVPSACNPSGSCTCRLNISHNDSQLSQHKRLVSTLTTTCNQSCICHKGNTDRFCSRCQEGFYKIGGLCFQCVKGDLTYYYVFIPIFAVSFLALLWSYFYFNMRPIKWFVVTAVHFLLMVIFMLLEFLPTWIFKLNLVVFVLCMTSRGKGTRSLISIAVFYIQTMDFMVSSANVWPQKVVAAQNYLSSYWNLYFPSLSCDLPSLFTPVGKFAFILLLPIGCLAMVGGYFVVMLAYNKVRYQECRMENVHFKCRQSAFFCLNFSYFPIVKQTLSILRPCQNDWNVLYMANSPWIECTSGTYKTLSALGVVSVVFYVIGFPLLLISMMFLFFRKRNSMSPEDREKLDTWLGPVYLPYKPRYQRYFEIVMLLRRLCLAIALSMISSSSTLQTVVVWLILMVFAVIHLCLKPYNDRSHHKFASENFFEPLVLFVLSMSFILSRFSTIESSFTTAFVWVVMIVNSCVLLVLVGTICYLLVTTGNCGSNKNSRECCNANGRDGRSGNDAERRHLLSVNSRQRSYMAIDNVA